MVGIDRNKTPTGCRARKRKPRHDLVYTHPLTSAWGRGLSARSLIVDVYIEFHTCILVLLSCSRDSPRGSWRAAVRRVALRACCVKRLLCVERNDLSDRTLTGTCERRLLTTALLRLRGIGDSACADQHPTGRSDGREGGETFGRPCAQAD